MFVIYYAAMISHRGLIRIFPRLVASGFHCFIPCDGLPLRRLN